MNTKAIEEILGQLTGKQADAAVAAITRLKRTDALIGAASRYTTAKRGYDAASEHLHFLLADFGAV